MKKYTQHTTTKHQPKHNTNKNSVVFNMDWCILNKKGQKAQTTSKAYKTPLILISTTVRTAKTLHKSHQKIQYYFQFSNFNSPCTVWSVWRGIKARRELGKREPPPPKSQGRENIYYLSFAIFLEKLVAKKTTLCLQIIFFWVY